MKTLEVKVTRVGNSRGIRLPADVIQRYRLGEVALLELREEEIALRPKKQKKLSWKDTYKEMAAAREDWSDMEGAIGDGVE